MPSVAEGARVVLKGNKKRQNEDETRSKLFVSITATCLSLRCVMKGGRSRDGTQVKRRCRKAGRKMAQPQPGLSHEQLTAGDEENVQVESRQ